MSNLYPLKFTPIYKEKIWGGDRLKELLNKRFGKLTNCGESWEISGIENEISIVANGFLKGNNLEELIEIYMGDLIGEKAYDQFGIEFPLLIKYIDAKDKLSIQVHPNDELAKERHGTSGKTEMWYVIHADEGARLITGFNRPLNREDYLEYFEKGQLESILNYEMVKAGDVFFIPAGRVHAIEEGIVLAEMQQTSDTTYRIFDFNRLDDKGNPRELHTELAIDAIDFKFEKNYRTSYKPVENVSTTLVKCQYFTTNILPITRRVERDFTQRDSFVIYMCIDGEYSFSWEEGNVEVKKGETILVPALINNFSLNPINGNITRLLEIYR
jgi:mannose-6-phosphate isomerase